VGSLGYKCGVPLSWGGGKNASPWLKKQGQTNGGKRGSLLATGRGPERAQTVGEGAVETGSPGGVGYVSLLWIVGGWGVGVWGGGGMDNCPKG